MKKLLLAAVLLLQTFAFGSANDVIIMQRNAADNGTINRLITSPVTDGVLWYNTSTLLPGWLTLGSGLSITGSVLSATAAAQVNSDWNAVSGVASILNKPSLSAVATSGAYSDLMGTPSLAAVATTGAYVDLTGRPSLATVATTGAYADLSGKPTIPAAQVNSDWNASSGLAQILNKPSLATVATSGSYNDLSNKPSIPSAFAVGSPNSRTLSLATAYQCTDTTKPCVVTVNLNSTASLSLSGGTTVIGEVRIGSTNGVATGSGTAVGAYKNSLTGTLTIGLNMQTDSYNTITIVVPAGWYFAVRQTSGSGLAIVSAFDQSAG